MQLIHVLVRPYVSTISNVFDGIILQLIVIISGLSTVKLVDNYNESSVLVITYFASNKFCDNQTLGQWKSNI